MASGDAPKPSDSAAKSPGASFARTSDADDTANTRKTANASRRAR